MADKKEVFVRWMKFLYILTLIPVAIIIRLIVTENAEYALGAGLLSISPIMLAMSILQFKFEIVTDEDLSRFWIGHTAKNMALLGMMISLVFAVLGILVLYFRRANEF